MVGQDPTGLALRIDTYVETKDNLTGTVIFTSINESVSDAAGEWDGHSVNMAYPVLEPLERERAYAQKTSGTLYCYDFLELIQRVLQKRWKRFLRSSEASSVVMPNTLMKARELVLDGSPGTYSLKEVVRGPGKNRIGMVAWIITLYTPTYPKEGRDIVVIANDITHKAGSFGTREDAFFDLVSRRARQLGIPRIFFAANSGARIGLAEEVKSLFRVKWVRDDCPDSGVEYLYLLDSDYKKIQKSVVATPVQLHGETVYRIDTIVGEASDLGVENLAGSRSNSFNILSYENITSFDFALRGFYTPENTTEEPATILKVSELDILERTKPQLSVPISMGAFRKYRWEIPWSSGGIPPLASIHMAYCKPVGAICPGEGAYPSVNEGEMSVKNCGYGYRGYSYRECTNGSLGPEVTTHCVLLPPENVRYSSTGFVFVIGQTVSTGIPLVRNIATNWEISSTSLPTGLSFNPKTGEISGIPTRASLSVTYSITARNDAGSASGEVSLEVIPEYIFFPQTSFIISVEQPFMLTPTLQRTAVVSVFSGSLPAGLTVDASTGEISGITRKN